MHLLPDSCYGFMPQLTGVCQPSPFSAGREAHVTTCAAIQLRFMTAGSVATQSGWVSVLSQEAFRQLNSADKAGQAPTWDAIKEAAEANDGLLTSSSPTDEQPFLFVGQILEASAAGVYSKQEEGAITGLLIATSDEEIQTP